MDNTNILINWAYNNVEQILFLVLSLLAIPLAFGVIFDRNIIRSGFLLIAVFGVISGLFLLLEAQFLALAQIMIYGVGITLVVVIALMLTNPKLEKDESPAIKSQAWPAALVSTCLFISIYFAITSANIWLAKNPLPSNPTTNIKILGTYLMTYYSLPFEFASILLLTALIGAVMLAKAEPKTSNQNNTKNNKGSKNALEV